MVDNILNRPPFIISFNSNSYLPPLLEEPELLLLDLDELLAPLLLELLLEGLQLLDLEDEEDLGLYDLEEDLDVDFLDLYLEVDPDFEDGLDVDLDVGLVELPDLLLLAVDVDLGAVEVPLELLVVLGAVLDPALEPYVCTLLFLVEVAVLVEPPLLEPVLAL